MTTRVSPMERIRGEIDELFASPAELGEVLEKVACLGVRLIMQTAVEAEVTEFLGRERYSRGEREREGSRNGYCATTIKTTAGPITIERPKLRDTDEAFASRLLGVGVTRTNALESLVIAGFVRGACRCVMSKRHWRMRSAPRRHCQSPASAGYVRPSRRSSTSGSAVS